MGARASTVMPAFLPLPCAAAFAASHWATAFTAAACTSACTRFPCPSWPAAQFLMIPIAIWTAFDSEWPWAIRWRATCCTYSGSCSPLTWNRPGPPGLPSGSCTVDATGVPAVRSWARRASRPSGAAPIPVPVRRGHRLSRRRRLRGLRRWLHHLRAASALTEQRPRPPGRRHLDRQGRVVAAVILVVILGLRQRRHVLQLADLVHVHDPDVPRGPVRAEPGGDV